MNATARYFNELSPRMSDALAKLKEHGRLERHPGGYWTFPNCPRISGVFVWAVGDNTLNALVTRGKATLADWQEGRRGQIPDRCNSETGERVMPQLGDGPIEQQYIGKMKALAATLDNYFNQSGPKQTGFVLLVFPFDGVEGRANYISNANRADVVVMLKEQIARFEGQPETQGRA